MGAKNNLSESENMAIEFLKTVQADTMGPIDTDEELAAALVYSSLIDKGYVQYHQKEGFTTYVLTSKKPHPVN